MTRLKHKGTISRPIISVLLGHQLLTLDLEHIFVSDGYSLSCLIFGA